MPTYEYECEKCGRIFEEFQSISAEPLTTCKLDGCDGSVHRLISPGAGFLFKGSGFYATDYRSNSYKQKAKNDTGSGSGVSSATPASGSSGKTGAAAPSSPATPASK